MEELKFLEEQQVSPELIKRVEEFRKQYEVAPETAERIVKPSIPFYGKDIQDRKPPEKIFWQRIWHIFLTARPIMFLFM